MTMSVALCRFVGMIREQITLAGNAIPGRGNTVNPFIVVDNASGFIDFAEDIFGAREVAEARAPTPSGELIHAELRIGDSVLLLADRLDGWPSRPGLLQLWVADIENLIVRATDRGALIVTPPAPFYGSLTLARVEDPWGNLWWLYQPVPGQADPTPAWEGGSDTVFRTIDEYMSSAEP